MAADSTDKWPLILHRVQLEEGFKNGNQKPDLLKHNSGSCYRNWKIFFSHSGSGKSGTGNLNHGSGYGLTNPTRKNVKHNSFDHADGGTRSP